MAAKQQSEAQNRIAPAGRGARGYRVMYALGITPWDQVTVPPELVTLIESPTRLAPGRALDLGCGNGRLSLYMARHGWQVTGVDYVARPLAEARAQSAKTNLSVRWVEGDVTRIPELGIGEGYDLLLDAGCFHGLDAAQRAAYALGVTASAAPGAYFLLMCFAPKFRGPAPHGLSRTDVLAALSGGWELLWEKPDQTMRLPRLLRDSSPTWYCLRRTSGHRLAH